MGKVRKNVHQSINGGYLWGRGNSQRLKLSTFLFFFFGCVRSQLWRVGSSILARGLLIVVASLVVEHGF